MAKREKMGGKDGYPKRPTKDWYTRSPAATEASKDRYRVLLALGNAMETYMFAPFGQAYDPGNYIHIGMRHYLDPQGQRFPTAEEAQERLRIAYGTLPRVGGTDVDKMTPTVRRLIDNKGVIGKVPTNNIQTVEWAQFQRERLRPEEVLQVMANRLNAALYDTPIFNYWVRQDLFAGAADIAFRSLANDSSHGYIYNPESEDMVKNTAKAETQSFFKLTSYLKELNYFLGEPYLHQTTVMIQMDAGFARSDEKDIFGR